ncbi:MAG: RnfABCDGE type electron transport complex subunit D [Parasporobacterium sp.]|nr:RnfABCDGE type electron transport complex subunit D [Parasporobacterium sp.]
MDEQKIFRISFFPHIRDKASTSRIMLDVIIALLPAAAFGVYNFGWRALLLILICTATCMLSELLWDVCMRRRIMLRDMSAVVTGLILALNLPPTLDWWAAVIGSVFAIVVVKMLFGGLGQNFMNPAVAAKCFLMISFAGRMNTFVFQNVASATPLEVLKAGGNVDLLQMFLGNTSGAIGETSALALLIGAVYLFIRRIIDFRIPLFYILTVVVYISIYSMITRGGIDGTFLAAHLLSGGLLLGAFYMATDYVTSPVSPSGRIIYAVILGLLTCTFRLFGSAAGSVAYAILIGNLLAPLIEKVTRRKTFGKGAHLK